ncbi:putative mitochondrial protein [Apostasia shenzhenica]|uniref:Putative mitochondrial protein n=1 Tax=Apostasia shenzhenica TaxID=1088818 RepID=A0A2I0B739_9ASPA|nr:putative mitochondrial protein [Apostasia shenzhenica]
MYKVIAKVLVHRLKEHISSLVSLEQVLLSQAGSSQRIEVCLLSPYLFILSSELLSVMIYKERQSGSLSEIKITPRAPTHSHLMFADDLLFFAKATSLDAVIVKRNCDRYCVFSGQRVNSEKSSIIFSPTTIRSQKTVIRRQLRMQESQQWRYLGIPLSKHKPKKADFSSVIAMIWNRISAWGAMCLSLISIKVIDEIEKLIRTFL